MREIKFRGKDIKGEWRYGSLVLATDHWNLMKGGFYKEWIVSRSVSDGGYLNLMRRYPVKAETIGQFTGLHDKNGKEIYEGDIVVIPRVPEKRRNNVLTRHVVTSNSISVCSWTFVSLTKEVLSLSMMGQTDFDDYKREVIGNIYDNPELNKITSLNSPARKQSPKPGIQVEFVVKDSPKSEPYVEHLSKHSSKVVFEVTQEEINNAMDKIIKQEGKI